MLIIRYVLNGPNCNIFAFDPYHYQSFASYVTYNLKFNYKMLKNQKLIIFLSFLAVLSLQDLKNDIDETYQRLQSHFWKEDTEFKRFRSWQHLKGLYQSQVHLNIVGKKNGLFLDMIRRKLALQDQNMFVTSFVLYGLLQAGQLGTIEVDHHSFSSSLQALTHFKDKNADFGLPQYSFWLQELKNGTWSASSANLNGVVNSINTKNKYIIKFLDRVSFGLYSFGKSLEKVFCIPADIDDSSVNLILLGLMKEVDSEHYHFWRDFNFNLNKFYNEIVMKYAYRPFDPSPNFPRGDQIDPRSYYVLRGFLQQKKKEADLKGVFPSVILPTTWILNTDQQINQTLKMPFSVNNIDASVNINFLFGLLFHIHQGQVFPSEEVKQMAVDVVDMLVYVIQQMVQKRPDILLLYYPSKFDFYWFVARTVGFLERARTRDDVLEYAKVKLGGVMRKTATAQLLKQKHKGKQANTSYWAEFLGNYAKKNRNQDAIFSTALALNALFDTWGIRKDSKYSYIPTIPEQVKDAITEGIKYLSLQLSKKQKNTQNVFFSGSIKTFINDYPYIFPANLILDNKGRPVNAQASTLEDTNTLSLDCVKGYIEQPVYEDMLKLKWFQTDVPDHFGGYNIQGSFFPFWSAASITHVMTLTAFSKYLHANEQRR